MPPLYYPRHISVLLPNATQDCLLRLSATFHTILGCSFLPCSWRKWTRCTIFYIPAKAGRLIVFPVIQPVSVSMASPQSYVQPSYSALHPDGIGVSDVPLNVYPPKQSIPSSCPVCHKSFRRWQDRNRHLQSHLPYWIGCSFDSCSWRGYRIDIFKKHWYREHQPTSRPPDENGSKLYDPVPLVDRIVEGSVLIEDAENWAVERIKKIAVVLEKEVLLADPWGWKDKNWMDSRQYSHRRFAKMHHPSTPALSSVPPTKLSISAPKSAPVLVVQGSLHQGRKRTAISTTALPHLFW